MMEAKGMPFISREFNKNDSSRKMNFCCHVCGACLTSREETKKHVKTHNRISKRKCPHCSVIFQNGEDFMQHLSTHFHCVVFDCDMCGLEFNSSVLFKKHMEVHTKDSPSDCNEMFSNCNSEQNLNTPIEDSPITMLNAGTTLSDWQCNAGCKKSTFGEHDSDNRCITLSDVSNGSVSISEIKNKTFGGDEPLDLSLKMRKKITITKNHLMHGMVNRPVSAYQLKSPVECKSDAPNLTEKSTFFPLKTQFVLTHSANVDHKKELKLKDNKTGCCTHVKQPVKTKRVNSNVFKVFEQVLRQRPNCKTKNTTPNALEETEQITGVANCNNPTSTGTILPDQNSKINSAKVKSPKPFLKTITGPLPNSKDVADIYTTDCNKNTCLKQTEHTLSNISLKTKNMTYSSDAGKCIPELLPNKYTKINGKNLQMPFLLNNDDPKSSLDSTKAGNICECDTPVSDKSTCISKTCNAESITSSEANKIVTQKCTSTMLNEESVNTNNEKEEQSLLPTTFDPYVFMTEDSEAKNAKCDKTILSKNAANYNKKKCNKIILKKNAANEIKKNKAISKRHAHLQTFDPYEFMTMNSEVNNAKYNKNLIRKNAANNIKKKCNKKVLKKNGIKKNKTISKRHAQKQNVLTSKDLCNEGSSVSNKNKKVNANASNKGISTTSSNLDIIFKSTKNNKKETNVLNEETYSPKINQVVTNNNNSANPTEIRQEDFPTNTLPNCFVSTKMDIQNLCACKQVNAGNTLCKNDNTVVTENDNCKVLMTDLLSQKRVRNKSSSSTGISKNVHSGAFKEKSIKSNNYIQQSVCNKKEDSYSQQDANYISEQSNEPCEKMPDISNEVKGNECIFITKGNTVLTNRRHKSMASSFKTHKSSNSSRNCFSMIDTLLAKPCDVSKKVKRKTSFRKQNINSKTSDSCKQNDDLDFQYKINSPQESDHQALNSNKMTDSIDCENKRNKISEKDAISEISPINICQLKCISVESKHIQCNLPKEAKLSSDMNDKRKKSFTNKSSLHLKKQNSLISSRKTNLEKHSYALSKQRCKRKQQRKMTQKSALVLKKCDKKLDSSNLNCVETDVKAKIPISLKKDKHNQEFKKKSENESFDILFTSTASTNCDVLEKHKKDNLSIRQNQKNSISLNTSLSQTQNVDINIKDPLIPENVVLVDAERNKNLNVPAPENMCKGKQDCLNSNCKSKVTKNNSTHQEPLFLGIQNLAEKVNCKKCDVLVEKLVMNENLPCSQTNNTKVKTGVVYLPKNLNLFHKKDNFEQNSDFDVTNSCNKKLLEVSENFDYSNMCVVNKDSTKTTNMEQYNTTIKNEINTNNNCKSCVVVVRDLNQNNSATCESNASNAEFKVKDADSSLDSCSPKKQRKECAKEIIKVKSSMEIASFTNDFEDHTNTISYQSYKNNEKCLLGCTEITTHSANLLGKTSDLGCDDDEDVCDPSKHTNFKLNNLQKRTSNTLKLAKNIKQNPDIKTKQNHCNITCEKQHPRQIYKKSKSNYLLTRQTMQQKKTNTIPARKCIQKRKKNVIKKSMFTQLSKSCHSRKHVEAPLKIAVKNTSVNKQERVNQNQFSCNLQKQSNNDLNKCVVLVKDLCKSNILNGQNSELMAISEENVPSTQMSCISIIEKSNVKTISLESSKITKSNDAKHSKALYRDSLDDQDKINKTHKDIYNYTSGINYKTSCVSQKQQILKAVDFSRKGYLCQLDPEKTRICSQLPASKITNIKKSIKHKSGAKQKVSRHLQRTRNGQFIKKEIEKKSHENEQNNKVAKKYEEIMHIEEVQSTELVWKKAIDEDLVENLTSAKASYERNVNNIECIRNCTTQNDVKQNGLQRFHKNLQCGNASKSLGNNKKNKMLRKNERIENQYSQTKTKNEEKIGNCNLHGEKVPKAKVLIKEIVKRKSLVEQDAMYNVKKESSENCVAQHVQEDCSKKNEENNMDVTYNIKQNEQGMYPILKHKGKIKKQKLLAPIKSDQVKFQMTKEKGKMPQNGVSFSQKGNEGNSTFKLKNNNNMKLTAPMKEKTVVQNTNKNVQKYEDLKMKPDAYPMADENTCIKNEKDYNIYVCLICKGQFDDQNLYNQHMVKHLFQKKYNCMICADSFWKNRELIRHAKTKHELKKNTCMVCGVNINKWLNFCSHVRTHNEFKHFFVYRCFICKKGFDRFHNFLKHKKSHKTQTSKDKLILCKHDIKESVVYTDDKKFKEIMKCQRWQPYVKLKKVSVPCFW